MLPDPRAAPHNTHRTGLATSAPSQLRMQLGPLLRFALWRAEQRRGIQEVPVPRLLDLLVLQSTLAENCRGGTGLHQL